MEIKEENIDRLMAYFAKCQDDVNGVLDYSSESLKMGLITPETHKSVERDALRLITEHQKIKNILFGTEVR